MNVVIFLIPSNINSGYFLLLRDPHGAWLRVGVGFRCRRKRCHVPFVSHVLKTDILNLKLSHQDVDWSFTDDM